MSYEEEAYGNEIPDATNTVNSGEGTDAVQAYAADVRQQQSAQTAAAEQAATDARLVRAAVRQTEEDATNSQVRTNQAMGLDGIMMIFQLLIAIFTNDTSGIDRAALGDFSESLGFDRNRLGNTVDRVANGEISGFRAATDTFRDLNPNNVDYEAASNIRIGDIVGRNTGPTLLHPDLVERMASDPTVRQYVEWTFESAEKNGLDDPAMLANQYWQESRYDPNAVSGVKAAGIAQIMPFHQGDWGLEKRADFFDARTSIEAGAQYMAHLTQEHGNQSLALVAYNGGGRAIEYADRNVAGDGVTLGQWMGFMDGQRASLGTGDRSKWRVQTYEYVEHIDSNYWDAATVERALELQERALASIDREFTPEQSQVVATAYRAEDNDLREGLQVAFPMGPDARITSDFGPRNLRLSPMHGGVDFSTQDVSADGRVQLQAQQPMTIIQISTQTDRNGQDVGFGHRVIASIGEDDAGRPITVQFAHLDHLPTHIKPGDVLEPGDNIAITGNSGTGTGAHLDVQVRIGPDLIDPEKAFTTDLSDPRVGDQLIAEAKSTLGRTANSRTYDSQIAPMLKTGPVQRGMAELQLRQQQAAQLLAQQQADEEAERLAAAQAETATQEASTKGSTYDETQVQTASLNQDVTAEPMGRGSSEGETPVAQAFGDAKSTKTPLDEGDTQQPVILSNAFDGNGGVDQTQVAVAETASQDAVIAADATADASRMSRTMGA